MPKHLRRPLASLVSILVLLLLVPRSARGQDGVCALDTEPRPDLAETADLLKRDLEIEYHPFTCW